MAGRPGGDTHLIFGASRRSAGSQNWLSSERRGAQNMLGCACSVRLVPRLFPAVARGWATWLEVGACPGAPRLEHSALEVGGVLEYRAVSRSSAPPRRTGAHFFPAVARGTASRCGRRDALGTATHFPNELPPPGGCLEDRDARGQAPAFPPSVYAHSHLLRRISWDTHLLQ